MSAEPPSGNIFADLGMADAARHQLKAQLVMRLLDMIRDQALAEPA